MPVSTIRAWTIGLLLTAVFGGLNLLFQLRSPPVRLSTYIAQIMAYGLGRLWDRVMPDKQFSIFCYKCNLRPGSFNHYCHGQCQLRPSCGYLLHSHHYTAVMVPPKLWFNIRGSVCSIFAAGRLWTCGISTYTPCIPNAHGLPRSTSPRRGDQHTARGTAPERDSGR